ncbi:MAG: flagellar hook-length control protein FliK [Pirellulales bacterium]|nr:flagellar hook-length control protein FliK [Pirellulales bacterium]
MDNIPGLSSIVTVLPEPGRFYYRPEQTGAFDDHMQRLRPRKDDIPESVGQSGAAFDRSSDEPTVSETGSRDRRQSTEDERTPGLEDARETGADATVTDEAASADAVEDDTNESSEQNEAEPRAGEQGCSETAGRISAVQGMPITTDDADQGDGTELPADPDKRPVGAGRSSGGSSQSPTDVGQSVTGRDQAAPEVMASPGDEALASAQRFEPGAAQNEQADRETSQPTAERPEDALSQVKVGAAAGPDGEESLVTDSGEKASGETLRPEAGDPDVQESQSAETQSATVTSEAETPLLDHAGDLARANRQGRHGKAQQAPHAESASAAELPKRGAKVTSRKRAADRPATGPTSAGRGEQPTPQRPGEMRPSDASGSTPIDIRTGFGERTAVAGEQPMDTGEAPGTQTVAGHVAEGHGESQPRISPDQRSHAALPQESHPAAEPEQVDRVRFVQRVARAFQAMGERNGSVRLRLSPPELGALRLEISVRDGTLTARVEAESATARSLLLDNLPALRDRLAQQDIKIEQFNVDLTGRSAGGLPDQTADHTPSHHREGGGGSPQGGHNVGNTEEEPAPRRTVSRSGEGSQLNVVV